MPKPTKPATAGLRTEWQRLTSNYHRTEEVMGDIASKFDPRVHACCPSCAFPQYRQLLTRNQNREIRMRQISPRISQRKITTPHPDSTKVVMSVSGDTTLSAEQPPKPKAKTLQGFIESLVSQRPAAMTRSSQSELLEDRIRASIEETWILAKKFYGRVASTLPKSALHDWFFADQPVVVLNTLEGLPEMVSHNGKLLVVRIMVPSVRDYVVSTCDHQTTYTLKDRSLLQQPHWLLAGCEAQSGRVVYLNPSLRTKVLVTGKICVRDPFKQTVGFKPKASVSESDIRSTLLTFKVLQQLGADTNKT